MDKTILNLLFNYKGAITSREFRTGIAVVILSMGVYFGSTADTFFINTIAGRGGVTWIYTISVYNQVVHFFTPHLVPVLFIISYSSFILGVKRIRMLTNNRTIKVASGVLNYLLFASFMTLSTLVVYMGNKVEYDISTLSIILCILLLMGVVNFVYLCIQKPSEPLVPSCPEGQLDISGYSIKFGKLMLVAAVVSGIMGVIFSGLGTALKLFPAIFFSSGIGVVVLFFYIKYSVYRLKDAGISVLWLVCIIVVYLAMVGLKIWLNLCHMNVLTLYYNIIFAIASSFFTLAQYALFLLPSRRVCRVEDSINN